METDYTKVFVYVNSYTKVFVYVNRLVFDSDSVIDARDSRILLAPRRKVGERGGEGDRQRVGPEPATELHPSD
jgi:hypothetical protein